MAIILPFWTSFLIRVYAWINILQRDGLLNEFCCVCTSSTCRSPGCRPILRSISAWSILICRSWCAALRHARKNGRKPAGGGRRSRLSALESVLVRDVSAVAYRALQPARCSVLSPSSANSLFRTCWAVRNAHDWADTVDRIFFQPRLAGCVRNHHCIAGAAADSDPFYERLQQRSLEGTGNAARRFTFQYRVGRARARISSLPITILVIFSFNASRLVTIWGGWSLMCVRELLTTMLCWRRPGSACALHHCRQPQPLLRYIGSYHPCRMGRLPRPTCCFPA